MTNRESNTYEGWIEALTIFNKYEPDAFYPVQPGHDIIYSGPDPEIVDAEDRARLAELGWHVDEDFECFCKFT